MNNKFFADFYVSLNGNDEWSGKLPEPNSVFTDGPFATIGRAKAAVRDINKSKKGDIYVFIREGVYYLDKTIVFSPQDSHLNSYKIFYSAYPGEKPIISSGIKLTNWAKVDHSIEGLSEDVQGKLWSCEIPTASNGKKHFYTMYKGEKMLKRSRSKGFEPTKELKCNDGFWDWKEMESANKDTLHFPEDSLKNWENIEDIEIFIQPNVGFVVNYLKVKSVDTENNIAKTTLPGTYSLGKFSSIHQNKELGGSFCVENAIEFIRKPGEWALNSKEGKIYYYPLVDEPMSSVKISQDNEISYDNKTTYNNKVTYNNKIPYDSKITYNNKISSDNVVDFGNKIENAQSGDDLFVPALTELIKFEGNEEKGEFVSNIVFKGITFTHGERDVLTQDDIGLQHDWDMWNKPNAIFRIVNARECEITECRFTNSGGNAIRLDLYCQDNIISNNLIDNIGGTGILLCGYGPGKKDVNKHNKIVNNHIHHCGELLYHSPAIFLWQSGSNIVKNNYLHDLPYDAIILSGVRTAFFNIKKNLREMTGTIRWEEIPQKAKGWENTDLISLGHQWHHVAPFMHTKNNIIQDNEIFLIMQKLFDGNAIYLSDVGRNNLVKRNYIHHLNGRGMQQGIRTDSYIKGTMITKNIVYKCNGGGINVKYYDNHVINNIIAEINDLIYKDQSGESTRIYIGYVSLLDVWVRDRVPAHSSTKIQRNIFYKTSEHQTFYRQKLVDGQFIQANITETEINSNLYFDKFAADLGEEKLRFLKSQGVDSDSIIGDPMFFDIDNGNFKISEDSNIKKIGFKPIEMDKIGLMHKEYPEHFSKIVEKQLGLEYNSFEELNKIFESSEIMDSNRIELKEFKFE